MCDSDFCCNNNNYDYTMKNELLLLKHTKYLFLFPVS